MVVVLISLVVGEDALQSLRRLDRFLLRFGLGARFGIETGEELAGEVVGEDGLRLSVLASN